MPILSPDVEDRHHVRVVDARECLRLTVEPFGVEAPRRRDPVQPLHRHGAMEDRVGCREDLPHPSAAHLPIEPVTRTEHGGLAEGDRRRGRVVTNPPFEASGASG